MNARSIQTLKRKFIIVAMLSFFLVMLFTGALINVANAFSTRSTLQTTLNAIIAHDGELPTASELAIESDSEVDGIDGRRATNENITPEFRYATRYFAIIYNKKGKIDHINTSHINAIDEKTAIQYMENIRQDFLGKYFTFGNYGDFYYKWGKTSTGNDILVFLDSSTLVTINRKIISSTFIICGVGMLITFIVVWISSGRIVEPEIENARRQKQFITNASHELKTPLAVIQANTEIEEMMNGSSEWTQSTKRQIDRLNSLIQNLVMITKAEEQEDRSILSEIDAGRAIDQAVEPYASLAIQEQKTLIRDIPDDVMFVADASKLQQLTALLVDNAFKYCDEGGTVRVSLQPLKKGKSIQLTVSNHYADGASVNYARFFDRFYREDRSRNQDQGGYGIGLSIAESICKSYNGTISASWKDGIISFTCILK